MHPIPVRPAHREPPVACTLRAGQAVHCLAKRQLRDWLVPASGGFALVETMVAVAIMAIGFLGAFATAVQASRMASAAEEDALVSAGLEQRLDQLRLLEWFELTDGTGITTKVWTARPVPTAGLNLTGETFTLSPWDVPGAKTLQGDWSGVSAPAISFAGGAQELREANAVRAIATLTWIGRRTARPHTRSLVTVISRGGISKSDLP